jgi:hypothetical protein
MGYRRHNILPVGAKKTLCRSTQQGHLRQTNSPRLERMDTLTLSKNHTQVKKNRISLVSADLMVSTDLCSIGLTANQLVRGTAGPPKNSNVDVVGLLNWSNRAIYRIRSPTASAGVDPPSTPG